MQTNYPIGEVGYFFKNWFSIWNKWIWIGKRIVVMLQFYTDLKNVNLPERQNVPKKVMAK
jgi:hypothetical protein